MLFQFEKRREKNAMKIKEILIWWFSAISIVPFDNLYCLKLEEKRCQKKRQQLNMTRKSENHSESLKFNFQWQFSPWLWANEQKWSEEKKKRNWERTTIGDSSLWWQQFFFLSITMEKDRKRDEKLMTKNMKQHFGGIGQERKWNEPAKKKFHY